MNKYMFTAKWCNQCQVMKPIVSKLGVQIIDIEEHPKYVDKYSVMSLPTYVVDDGKFKILTGIKPLKLLEEFYEQKN